MATTNVIDTCWDRMKQILTIQLSRVFFSPETRVEVKYIIMNPNEVTLDYRGFFSQTRKTALHLASENGHLEKDTTRNWRSAMAFITNVYNLHHVTNDRNEDRQLKIWNEKNFLSDTHHDREMEEKTIYITIYKKTLLFFQMINFLVKPYTYPWGRRLWNEKTNGKNKTGWKSFSLWIFPPEDLEALVHYINAGKKTNSLNGPKRSLPFFSLWCKVPPLVLFFASIRASMRSSIHARLIQSCFKEKDFRIIHLIKNRSCQLLDYLFIMCR